MINIGKEKEVWVEATHDKYVACHTVKCFGVNIKCKECILSTELQDNLMMVSIDMKEMRKHDRVK